MYCDFRVLGFLAGHSSVVFLDILTGVSAKVTMRSRTVKG